MADIRCVRCGCIIGGGFLCDPCQQYGVSPGPQFQGRSPIQPAYDDAPIKPRWVDPMALGAAAMVVMLGLIAFLEWPKLQRAMSGSVASSGIPTKTYPDDTDDSSVQQRTSPRSSTLSTAVASPYPPHPTGSQVVSSRQPEAPPAKIQPIQSAADSSSLATGNEQEAAQTLNAFLNEYCTRRAGVIRQMVKATTVTWWPMGAGVVVELDEGGVYRQGTAQFTPKAGWAWLIRPDAVASSNSN